MGSHDGILGPVARVGLVLGGGGITGAAYQMAGLMALELATGWHPNDADVVVGTSGGAFVGAVLRCGNLNLDTLVQPHDTRDDVTNRLRSHVFRRPSNGEVGRTAYLGRWLRHGIVPGLRRPGVSLILGSPARFDPAGVGRWLTEQVGESALHWPARPTIATAYDLGARQRVAFGTEGAPDVTLADAVAASSAVPLFFCPHRINGRDYVDGGILSGTHADLLLGSADPLDVVIVLAPMAAEEERSGAWFHERMFDRVGTTALSSEIASLRAAWPDVEVLVFRPPTSVLAAMRPNVMAPDAAVPSFVRSLVSFRRTLAQPEVWSVLHDHLGSAVGVNRPE